MKNRDIQSAQVGDSIEVVLHGTPVEALVIRKPRVAYNPEESWLDDPRWIVEIEDFGRHYVDSSGRVTEEV